MDPRTGRPVQGVLTVAVLTGTGTAGDALDDGLFVLGVGGQPRVPGRAAAERRPSSSFRISTNGWRMVRLVDAIGD